jgi:hypothetical protein
LCPNISGGEYIPIYKIFGDVAALESADLSLGIFRHKLAIAAVMLIAHLMYPLLLLEHSSKLFSTCDGSLIMRLAFAVFRAERHSASLRCQPLRAGLGAGLGLPPCSAKRGRLSRFRFYGHACLFRLL